MVECRRVSSQANHSHCIFVQHAVFYLSELNYTRILWGGLGLTGRVQGGGGGKKDKRVAAKLAKQKEDNWR